MLTCDHAGLLVFGPQLHEDMITLKGIASTVRQIAIRNIDRDQPTLLIINEVIAQAKDLFARYTERMIIENELGTYSGGFHLDALTSAIPRNVDFDTPLTCALNLRSHHPILIDAGYADLDIPIPWWNDRTLRFRFPPPLTTTQPRGHLNSRTGNRG